MKAKYFLKSDDTPRSFAHPVIVPANMQHTDGFTLLGFDSWEDVNDEKLCAAVINVSEFHLMKDNMGFGNDKD